MATSEATAGANKSNYSYYYNRKGLNTTHTEEERPRPGKKGFSHYKKKATTTGA